MIFHMKKKKHKYIIIIGKTSINTLAEFDFRRQLYNR